METELPPVSPLLSFSMALDYNRRCIQSATVVPSPTPLFINGPEPEWTPAQKKAAEKYATDA